MRYRCELAFRIDSAAMSHSYVHDMCKGLFTLSENERENYSFFDFYLSSVKFYLTVTGL